MNEPAGKSRSRQSIGPKLGFGSDGARKWAATILQVLAGEWTQGEGAQSLGVSLPRYYAMEMRAMAGVVKACEPRSGKHVRLPEKEVVELKKQVVRLERECARKQALLPSAPICSSRLGNSPYVTCPVEQFRVISTLSAAILLLPGKSELLSSFHQGVGVYSHVWRENGTLYSAPADNAAIADERIQRDAHATRLSTCKDHLRRWTRPGGGVDREGGIIKVGKRIDLNQIHAGFVIGIQRPDVAPVIPLLVTEAMGENGFALDKTRQDVSAKVSAGLAAGLRRDPFGQSGTLEQVNSHVNPGKAGAAGDGFGVVRLFLKRQDAIISVDLEDAQAGS
jgi:hypothetical protein